ncbi:MAG: glycoside hydrolase [Bacteroidota bacterium]
MNRTIITLLSIFMAVPSFGQIPEKAFQNLEYRLIGPFRASRTVGAVGIPDQPNVFYVGVNNGGVWKTDDYGRTWNPIFDDAPTGSVGDIAVAPSNPEILYVGSGEGLHRPDLGVGDGMFKSIDGGKTWNHIGLGDIQQVARVIIHPDNPEVVYVAGLGHPYGPNEERGVFRTKDGGVNWEKILYINHNTGATQVEFDPSNPNIIYAAMWEHREGPWENARLRGKNCGLYKSTDGGDNWELLSGGLPTQDQGLGRVGIGIAPSNPNLIFACVDAREGGGIYKSTDAGASWTFVNGDRRLWGRGDDFAEIEVHPKNTDRLFVGNIASYQSDDGGKTWTSIKGAPGGDDYHRIWINPLQPDIMIFAADQGATITVNGGRTWSSWYNQPTAQIYHVTTDNAFPYWVYGGQQESGAIGTASRGNGGQISFRDWIGVGADEYAYIAPDPKDPNIIYGGRVVRFNKKTGQTQNIAPEALRSGKYRILRTMPLLFHPANDEKLLFATNVLWQTTDGGQHWDIISPDLSRVQPEVPASVGDFKTQEMETMARRGVIYSLAPSPIDEDVIWAGTDDGLVHITMDGGASWQNVTPPEMGPWDKVAQLDAGHFAKGTAFMAVNAIRKDDMKPYIYRTDDYGKSWELVTEGMNPNGPVNVVREDPKQAGLLYTGTEREVYFSVDNGYQWHSLRRNMPATSIRDLVIKGNDLVVGTHGRSIWILDGVHPLRELAKIKNDQIHLFQPTDATRVRWNMFSDTPLPPEEPAGQNPPDGAIIDYYLPDDASEVSIQILDRQGNLVREYHSDDSLEKVDPNTLPHPTYWMQPIDIVGNTKGHHRFIWDLRYTPPEGTRRQFSIAAVKDRTPSGPHGPFVTPGVYAVRLNVDGKFSIRNIHVNMDPRVEASDEDIALQTKLSMACYQSSEAIFEMIDEIDASLRTGRYPEGKRNDILKIRGTGQVGDPDILYGSIYSSELEQESLVSLRHKFLFMLNMIQGADARPTSQAMKATQELQGRLMELKSIFNNTLNQ